MTLLAGRFLLGASLFLLAAPADAQQPLQITPPPPPTGVTVAPEAAKGARQEELEKVQAEQKKNAEIAMKLKAEIDAIGEDRRKLNALLIGSAATIRGAEDRIAAAEIRLKALEAERARAVQLARQADNLKDLIGRIEQDIAASARAAAAARADKPSDPKNSLAALQDPGRLSPAIAFASARKLLPLPLNGVKIREFGMPDGLGGTEKGLSIASRAGAQVTAPCDGWVVYAGPFRSYGQLLILNAGGGYHVLLAGMERISVDLGQFVLTGEPVAVMGGGPQSAAAIAVGSSQPVLYIEFRKDGAPVDPNPWWATKDSEKVRG